jgi:hypothetical protein
VDACHRLPAAFGTVVLLVALLGVTAAVGEVDGPQLTVVSKRPIEAEFKDDTAKFGVTLRNDSKSEQTLKPRLLLDTGAEVPVEPKGVDVKVGGQQVKLTLSGPPASLKVAPRDAARVALELKATPVLKDALSGVLVISGSDGEVTPLTVPVALAAAASKDRFEKARFEPDSITLIVRRRWPSFVSGGDDDLSSDGMEVSLKGIAAGTERADKSRKVAIAGDTGGQGRLKVTIPGVDPTATKATISVDAEKIERHGTYETAIPFDPAAEKSPTLTVKVLSADHWVWPLLVLIVGAGVAYGIVRSRDMVRPKYVLQLALTRAQALNKLNVDGQKGLKPYTLESRFPSGEWDCKKLGNSPPAALTLYCKIDAAERQEDLDALGTLVADLEAQVNAWPSVCAKAQALKTAADEVSKKNPSAAMVKASEALLKPAIPGDEAATKAYMDSLDAQVEAVREWLNAEALYAEAFRLFDAAGAPEEHDPVRWRPDLDAAKSLEDLRRCQVVRGLCRDVHVLRTLVMRHKPPSRAALESGQAMPGVAPDGVFEFISIKAAPPALPGPELTKHLIGVIGATDFRMFIVTTAVVALAYLAGIYSNTYGSTLEYLTAFAAGAGTTFAANWKLLPWYSSYKPPKP